MLKRKKLNNRYSKKLFSKTARRVHRKNLRLNPMRGGIRA